MVFDVMFSLSVSILFLKCYLLPGGNFCIGCVAEPQELQ